MDTIKIEHKGKKQVLNIPDKYKIKDKEVYIKKIGNTLVILPINNSWQTLFDSLDKFTDDFMNERVQPEIS